MKRPKTFFPLTIILVVLLIGSACQNDDDDKCIEHTVSVCNAAVSKINLRIKNVSKYDFCNVVINPFGAETNYGIIEKGASTCYRSFDIAYRYAYVQFSINGKEFVLQPIDYVGEEPLEIGNHTYLIDVIDFKKGYVSIGVE